MAQSKDEYLDISGIDKVILLQRLWENTGSQGTLKPDEEPFLVKAIWQKPRLPFRSDKALKDIDRYIDYYDNRPIKCDLSGDKVNPWLYDRDCQQKMWKTVEEIRNEMSSLSSMPDDEVAQWELCTKEFYHSLCLTCCKISSLRCKGCGLVAYCSNECMKKAQTEHKELCEALSKAQGKNTANFAAALSSPQVLEDTWLKVEKLLERPLKYFEMDILTRPKVCNHCNSADQNKLKDCSRCRCVSYCCTKHSENDYKEHQFICDDLRRAIQAYKYLRTCRRNIDLFPTDVAEEYVELKGNEFVNKKYKSLEGQLEDDSLLNNRRGIEKELGIMSDRASYVLIALYVLQEYGIGDEHIKEVNSLTIDILLQEFILDFSVWEFFMHRLPELKSLSLQYIGKNTKNSKGEDRKKGFPCSEKLCTDCQNRGRQLNITIWFGYYNEYFSSDDYEYPDLIINYNSLFHHESEEVNLNRFKTVSNMTVGDDTLVLVTSPWKSCLIEELKLLKAIYTKYSKDDTRSLEYLVEPTENPYRSQKPTRGPPGGKKCVRYENHYYMIFRGKEKDIDAKGKFIKGNKSSKNTKSSGKKGRRKD